MGVGSATHLSAERFLASAGVQAVHIPFKGGAEAMTEVIAGLAEAMRDRLPPSGLSQEELLNRLVKDGYEG